MLQNNIVMAGLKQVQSYARKELASRYIFLPLNWHHVQSKAVTSPQFAGLKLTSSIQPSSLCRVSPQPVRRDGLMDWFEASSQPTSEMPKNLPFYKKIWRKVKLSPPATKAPMSSVIKLPDDGKVLAFRADVIPVLSEYEEKIAQRLVDLSKFVPHKRKHLKYTQYAFDNPFSKNLRQWFLEDLQRKIPHHFKTTSALQHGLGHYRYSIEEPKLAFQKLLEEQMQQHKGKNPASIQWIQLLQDTVQLFSNYQEALTRLLITPLKLIED